eukprot:1389304-Amphidinium_carterae.1
MRFVEIALTKVRNVSVSLSSSTVTPKQRKSTNKYRQKSVLAVSCKCETNSQLLVGMGAVCLVGPTAPSCIKDLARVTAVCLEPLSDELGE